MLSNYTDLITSEHNKKPNFMAVIAALIQPFVDIQAQEVAMPQEYDLDTAVGVQLDTVGEWVGIGRYVAVPLTGVYFAFDTTLVGFDQGTWFGPFDDTTTLTRLPDDAYRALIRAKILDNNWDGSVPGAYTILNALIPGAHFVVQDNQDMTMLVGFSVTPITSAVLLALFYGNYIDIKPIGVRLSYYVAPSAAGPLFGFDVTNTTIAGFDAGGWATLTPGR